MLLTALVQFYPYRINIIDQGYEHIWPKVRQFLWTCGQEKPELPTKGRMRAQNSVVRTRLSKIVKDRTVNLPAKAFDVRQGKIEDCILVDSCCFAYPLADVVDLHSVTQLERELLNTSQESCLVQPALTGADNPHSTYPASKECVDDRSATVAVIICRVFQFVKF